PPFGPSYRMTTTSPATTEPPRIASTASSCDSYTFAGPRNTSRSSCTPAVLTTHPSGARLPYRIARPPSAEYAWATSRTQPLTGSVSSDSHRLSVENGSVVRTPPGAAWNSSTASGRADPPRTSQSASQRSSEGEWTACTS